MSKHISWDEYFMGVSILSSLRSKDPNTKVGACIVNKNKRIVGIGYNGFPVGCSDDEFPWGRDGEFLKTKYPFVVHAEANAILNSTTDTIIFDDIEINKDTAVELKNEFDNFNYFIDNYFFYML